MHVAATLTLAVRAGTLTTKFHFVENNFQWTAYTIAANVRESSGLLWLDEISFGELTCNRYVYCNEIEWSVQQSSETSCSVKQEQASNLSFTNNTSSQFSLTMFQKLIGCSCKHLQVQAVTVIVITESLGRIIKCIIFMLYLNNIGHLVSEVNGLTPSSS